MRPATPALPSIRKRSMSERKFRSMKTATSALLLLLVLIGTPFSALGAPRLLAQGSTALHGAPEKIWIAQIGKVIDSADGHEQTIIRVRGLNPGDNWTELTRLSGPVKQLAHRRTQ